MKRILSVCTAIVILLTACSQQATLTWQEQYDLGVKYLSEGNYEEAVIAFTAAIEIDPKRGDSYLALADVYISAGDYETAAAILQQGRQAGLDADSLDRFEEAVARYESVLEFLDGGENGIRITNLRFDEASYLAGHPTQFKVSVAYHCPVDEECIVMIGANTDNPDSFRMLDEDYTVTGDGGYQFDVTMTPKQWDDHPFGVYVNLSEADHDEDWAPLGSDEFFLDWNGNVTAGSHLDQTGTAGDSGSGEDGPPESGIPAQAMGSLSLNNLTYSFDADSAIKDYNDGAIGGMYLNFTAAGPSNVRSVYIASWSEYSFTQEELDRNISNKVDVWKQAGIGEDIQIPPFETGAEFPVDPELQEKTVEVLLIGLDKNGDAAGYATVSVAIP